MKFYYYLSFLLLAATLAGCVPVGTTHPADDTRIQDLQNLIPRVIPLYEAARTPPGVSITDIAVMPRRR